MLRAHLTNTTRSYMKGNDYGLFLRWLIKNYSTATMDGLFCYVNSMDKEVTIKQIVDEYLLTIHAK